MAFCPDCKPKRFLAVMTLAAICGHEVTKGGMDLCPKCARLKDACEACSEPLNPDPPPHTD